MGNAVVWWLSRFFLRTKIRVLIHFQNSRTKISRKIGRENPATDGSENGGKKWDEKQVIFWVSTLLRVVMLTALNFDFKTLFVVSL